MTTKAQQFLESVKKLKIKESAGLGYYVLDKDKEPNDGPYKTRKEAAKSTNNPDETIAYGDTSDNGVFTPAKEPNGEQVK